MSDSKRNQIVTALVIVVVLAGILVWHFVIGPWLDKHKTEDTSLAVPPSSDPRYLIATAPVRPALPRRGASASVNRFARRSARLRSAAARTSCKLLTRYGDFDRASA